MNEALRRKWNDLLRDWAVVPINAQRSFDDLCQHYATPGRFYHDLKHVEEVLKTVDALASLSPNPNVVRLAAWFHDAVYESRAPDNEERSAEYAKQMCKSLSISDGDRVADLVMKTKTHDCGTDADALVLIDADLAILGADEVVYREYANKIRQEYDWVPEQQFRIGRRQVLERFLNRANIFQFLTDLEGPARRNLTAELAQLSVD
jgi:predicted metal-dependent HD superfamily phosphohydrolase